MGKNYYIYLIKMFLYMDFKMIGSKEEIVKSLIIY